ncbi:hypothetical protein ACJMK2_038366 [Sinanodonta woodiana]|uniref:Uncharacterized protein n=1 Tax=Sinanodonta woodiana TaxID=1069815 RepID=A0ABD3W8S1_SINWO
MPNCVCYQHFVRVKSYLGDKASPAWMLHLGKPEFIRFSQREQKRALSDAAVSLRSLTKRHIDIDYSKSVTEEHSASPDISAQCDAVRCESVIQLAREDESHSKGIQTDLTI